MITFNTYHRVQLKEPVLLYLKDPPTHTNTALYRQGRTDYLIEIYNLIITF